MTARGRRIADTLSALGRPQVRVMVLLGFSSGLPFMLIANTLGFWLRVNGLSLGAIGALSWVGLAYSLKFLWAPVIDRVGLPFTHAFGRRRGWMLAAQVLVAAGLLGMAAIGPQSIGAFVGMALLVAFSSATQDIVVDAWRIEAAQDADELGVMTAAYQLGYRVALLATMSWILILTDFVGWNLSYAIFGALMAAGVAATLMAREPDNADTVMQTKDAEAPLWSPSGFFDAVMGPFVEFFRAHKLFGLVMLLTITLYHLSDYLRGPIVNPFYHDAGYTPLMVGAVRTTIGLWATVAGVAAAGVCSLKFGHFRTLILGAVLQPIGIGGFALVALAGAPNVPLFAVVDSLDDFAIGFSGVALIAYMSSLTSLGYTASQYAVMSSAVAWTGKILKGFSGFIVQGLQHGRDLMHAYALFYLGVAVLGIPAVFLCFVLAGEARKRAREAASAA